MIRKWLIFAFLSLMVVLSLGVVSKTPDTYEVVRVSDNILPYFLRNSSNWADSTLQTLTLRQKIAQSFMVATWPNKPESHQLYIDSLIENYEIGGLIYFQGDTLNTKNSIDRFQQQSKIPLLIGMDAEWGAAMRLFDKARFPYGLTLGAASSPKSTQKIAEAMAWELKDLGIHLNFAPVLDVNSNPNNPVIGFRSFGENAQAVGNQGMAFIKGLEKYNILSCMKHFPGHGDTDKDSHYELPTVSKSLMEIDIVDWTPFKMGRLAGASAVMMAHLNIPALDSSQTPTSLSKPVIQGYLREKLNFSGLIISDALNMKAVSNRFGKVEVVKLAYLAGNDILLYPEDVNAAIDAIIDAVNKGLVSKNEVDEKCFRILKAKYHTIIQAKSKVKPDNYVTDFALNDVYEKALTVIKNVNAIPIGRVDQKMALVTLGKYSNSFLERSKDYAQMTEFHAYNGKEAIHRFKDSLLDYDIIVVNVHAHSMLPKNDFGFPKDWRIFLDSLPERASVLVNLFGNPYVLKENAEFEKADAIVLGFENHQRSHERAAQLVFGGFASTGKLPVTINKQLKEGFGIATPQASRLKYTSPEELGIHRDKLKEIDSIAEFGIVNGAYPGCQVLFAKDGKVFYEKAYGYYTYDSVQEVTTKTIYDIASITKIAASTLSLMRLEDQKKLSRDSTLGAYLSIFKQDSLSYDSLYAQTSIKDMLAHQAGFVPWIPFYLKTLTNKKPDSKYYSKTANDSMQYQVSDSLFILNSYADSMLRIIMGKPIKEKKYKYSDLGFYFAKYLIESVSEENLDEFALSKFYTPMGLTSTRYNPLNYFDKSAIAPTEIDTYFRYQLLQGYVHDMGAAMTNGVGGHAGLFSNARDLASILQMLLNNGVYGGERYLSKEIIKKYTACQFCPDNRRGAGFDKPVRSLEGGPTCNLVSLDSYGHTGFTGTQFWADPSKGINYVFLSNRIYPTAENRKLMQLNIRTEIQRVLYEAINEAKVP